MSGTGMGSGRDTPAQVLLRRRFRIRSFQTNPDESVLTHQNHYDYADGRRETKTFGPYTPSTTRCLFIDQSFSWGSPSVAMRPPFETGFRWADRRMSCVVQYNASGPWQPFLVIVEHLGRFMDRPSPTTEPVWTHGSPGTRQTMTPDWRVSAPAAIPWQRLEDLEEHHLPCRLPDGVAISVPHRLEPGTPFRGLWSGLWMARCSVVYVYTMPRVCPFQPRHPPVLRSVCSNAVRQIRAAWPSLSSPVTA